MKYVKATLKYLFSHFPRLIVISVIPAAFAAFLMEPQGFVVIMGAETLEKVHTFADVFFLVFNRNLILRRPYLIVIGLLLFMISISYTMGIVEKHFKVGKLSLKNPFSNINNCFSSVFKAFGLLIIIYIVYKFLLVCVLMLLSLILGGLNLGQVWISVVIGLLSAAGFIGLLILVRPIMFTAATMLVYGYLFKDAFSVALKLGEGKDKTALNFALCLPFAVYFVISALLGILGAPYIAVSLVHTVMLSLLVQYVVVYVLIAMFDMSGIERRDQRKYYWEGV